jgi:hypothetical protein
VSSPPASPEDGNRSSFRNIVFFGIQDDGKSPEKCEFCTSIILFYTTHLPYKNWSHDNGKYRCLLWKQNEHHKWILQMKFTALSVTVSLSFSPPASPPPLPQSVLYNVQIFEPSFWNFKFTFNQLFAFVWSTVPQIGILFSFHAYVPPPYTNILIIIPTSGICFLFHGANCTKSLVSYFIFYLGFVNRASGFEKFRGFFASAFRSNRSFVLEHNATIRQDQNTFTDESGPNLFPSEMAFSPRPIQPSQTIDTLRLQVPGTTARNWNKSEL